MKTKFDKINKKIINSVLIISIFIFLSGLWDWISSNSTLRGEVLTVIAGILVLLLVALRIIHIDKVKRVLRGQLS